MPELPNSLVRWLATQVESLAPEIPRENAWSATMDRVLSSAMGTRESANLRALLETPPDEKERRSTILIPGILGSLLASTQGISAILWLNPTLLIHGYLNLLDLAEDGETDASPDVDITPIGIEKMAYLPIIQTLGHHSRLYEFPYDWRKSNVASAHRLHQSIERWSAADPSRRFSIVCHSMGGVIARTYMALYPQEAEEKLERLVMIGVPLHGAAVAALAFTDEHHPYMLIAHLNKENKLVPFTRGLPSAYQLLPAPREQFPEECDYPCDWDLYDAAAWPEPGMRQDYLDRARELHELLATSDPQVPMFHFVGCHKPTVTSVQRSSEDYAGLRPVYGEHGKGSGDEQVPLWSTRAHNIATYYVEESHVALVRNDRVLADVVALLRDEAPSLPQQMPRQQTPAGPLSNIPLAQQLAEMRERIKNGTLTRVDLDHLFFWR